MARLTLARPAKLNALSATLLEELPLAARWLDERADVKVVIVSGTGPHFSAGYDLDDFRASEGSPHRNADLGRLAADALADTRALTIAAIRGHCIGGGVVLAAACDLRVAAASARFMIPEVDLGIPLAWGGIPRLVREIGPALTKELVLTCRPFDAQEAATIRFVNRVVADDDLDRSVSNLATELAAKPGFALRSTKAHVNAVIEEMAGTGRNQQDADTLFAALHDDESKAISRAYLERRGR